jgi:hypothetical protein
LESRAADPVDLVDVPFSIAVAATRSARSGVEVVEILGGSPLDPPATGPSRVKGAVQSATKRARAQGEFVAFGKRKWWYEDPDGIILWPVQGI